jgi:hypothetical protein
VLAPYADFGVRSKASVAVVTILHHGSMLRWKIGRAQQHSLEAPWTSSAPKI